MNEKLMYADEASVVDLLSPDDMNTLQKAYLQGMVRLCVCARVGLRGCVCV